ncbi:MAG: deoxyribonuclease IV [Patescibacteria group bacterium]|jgi:deoxyribonuclease-4
MRFGLHVSIAGSIANAPTRAHDAGAECFQIFSRSPQGGPAPKITDELIVEFQKKQQEYGLTHAAIHTPYYINLASAKPALRASSVRIIREELERASMLGVQHVMTHLGSAHDQDEKIALNHVAEGIGHILKGYTGSAILLLENAAGAGKVVGDTFEELNILLESADTTKSHTKAGICFDTCHAFASGHDLRTPESVLNTLAEFDKKVGLDRLLLIHANDSMGDLGDHKDRHEHIGYGKIGREGFNALVSHPKLHNVNMILETRHDGKEIEDLALLKSLRDHGSKK